MKRAPATTRSPRKVEVGEGNHMKPTPSVDNKRTSALSSGSYRATQSAAARDVRGLRTIPADAKASSAEGVGVCIA